MVKNNQWLTTSQLLDIINLPGYQNYVMYQGSDAYNNLSILTEYSIK